MPADAILVIDAGTSAMRALLVSVDGSVEPVGIEPWQVFVPDDAAPFGREFRAGSVEASLRRLLAAAARVRERIAAIAVTGQREGMAFVDAGGDEVLSSPNIDARASAEGFAIDAAHGDVVYAATGHLPSLMLAPAKVRWLAANRPADAARVAHVLPLVDWLAMLLTGVPCMSRSLAAENGLLDVRSNELPASLLELLGIDARRIPPVSPEGTIVGTVMANAVALAGLPVVLAGADTQCALVGMSALAPGDAGVVAGWSAPVQLVTASAVFDCERRTWTGLHVLPERWILESNASETGRAWEWLCGLLGLAPLEAELLASTAASGAGDAMAVLGARAMNAAQMNAGMGALTMPLPLVMAAPDRSEVLRSVLESTAYAIRANLEQIETVAHVVTDRLRLGGGTSRSPLFAQILADVLDRDVIVAARAETSAVGAAIVASMAVGMHVSIDDAVAAMATGGTTLAPDARRSAEYEDYYARWCMLADAMARLATETE